MADLLPDSVFENNNDNNMPLLSDSIFDESQSSTDNQPIRNMTMKDTWYNPMLASLFGGAKGLGTTLEKAGTLSGKIASALTGKPNPYPSGQSMFDYSNPKNSITRYLGKLEQNYPGESAGAGLAANIIPYFAAPEIGGIEAIGSKISPSVSNFLSNNLIGRGISGAVNNGVVGALTSPIYNPDKPTLESMKEGATNNSLVGGLAPLAIGIPKNAISRVFNSVFSSGKKAQEQAGRAYDSINAEAEANKFKADMTPYENTLYSYLNRFGSEPRGSINDELENKIYSYADNLEKDIRDRPNVFNVNGLKSLTRGIGDEIKNAKTLTEKKVLTDIQNSVKQSLLSSLHDYGLGHLADKYLDTDKYYSQEVIPLKNNPTSPLGIASQAAGATTLAHLPYAIRTPSMIAMGLHGGQSPIAGLTARLFGNYRGGVLNSLLRNSQNQNALFSAVNKLSVPFMQGIQQ